MNALDIVLLLLLSFFIVRGFNRGLVMQLTDLAGFFLALIIAGALGSPFVSFIRGTLNLEPELLFPGSPFLGLALINITGYVVVFLLARVLFFIAGRVVNSIARLPVIGTFNAAGGALMGMVKGFLATFVIIGIISFIPSDFFQALVRDSVICTVAFTYLPVVIDLIRGVLAGESPLTV